jgi:hypothetical protein
MLRPLTMEILFFAILIGAFLIVSAALVFAMIWTSKDPPPPPPDLGDPYH